MVFARSETDVMSEQPSANEGALEAHAAGSTRRDQTPSASDLSGHAAEQRCVAASANSEDRRAPAGRTHRSVDRPRRSGAGS